MRKTKKFELNFYMLNVEEQFTIFTSKKNYGIPCAIRYLKRWDNNHPITSSYPVPLEKNLHIKAGQYVTGTICPVTLDPK